MNEEITGPQGPEISYSRINAYQVCPWKYQLLYVEGYRVPPNPFIALGQSVHRALEDFHERGRSTLDELMDSFDAAWVNEGFASPLQTQEFYEKGQRMLEVYHRDDRGRTAAVHFTEKEFRFAHNGVTVCGIIDRLDRHTDGTFELIDYKTHAELWTQEKVDSDLQLSIYALACDRALGFHPERLTYYFLAHGKRISTTRSERQEAEALALIEDVAERIRRKEFAPNTASCPRCDFRSVCRHSVARGPVKG